MQNIFSLISTKENYANMQKLCKIYAVDYGESWYCAFERPGSWQGHVPRRPETRTSDHDDCGDGLRVSDHAAQVSIKLFKFNSFTVETHARRRRASKMRVYTSQIA